MKRVLFIASHRKDRAPGQRFRFEQYMDFLSQNGFECELSYLISEEDDKMLYQQGKYIDKARFVRRCHNIRTADVARANEYDIIFIFREALMSRSTKFEQAFAKSTAKVIFDFDDSIWLANVSAANKRFSWMKNPSKTSQLIGWSDMVFAGNQYLSDYALQFNSNVKVIPTTIDTDEYKRIAQPEKKGVCIGWSGSITTIQHFEYAIPFLHPIKEKYGDKVNFKVIGDLNYRNNELGIQGIGWNKESELTELRGIDVGIMPLPDDEWAKGKCGLKGLQYMALEIPTLMSPVGVNMEIIIDGKNGYLANETDDWINKLSQLIDDKELRLKMGAEARQTVVDRYSVGLQKDQYLRYFQEVLQGHS